MLDKLTKLKTDIPSASVFNRGMLAMILLFGSLPFWGEYVGIGQYLCSEVLIWCIFAMAYNLALGYTGLPSFGHGAFFGVGAYGMAIYQINGGGTNLFIGLFFAILAAAVVGALCALFLSHRRGIYFSLLTIALGQIIYFAVLKWRSVTNGEDGIQNLSRLDLFGIDLSDNVKFYYFVLICLLIVTVILWRLVYSRFGRIIQALKQNESRTKAIGYDVRVYKFVSFTASCGLAGLAGGLYALQQNSAYPNVMGLHESGQIVMMVVIGGAFISFWGPMAGAIYFIVLRSILGQVSDTWLLWYGLSFMIIIMFKPEGIVGLWRNKWNKLLVAIGTVLFSIAVIPSICYKLNIDYEIIGVENIAEFEYENIVFWGLLILGVAFTIIGMAYYDLFKDKKVLSASQKKDDPPNSPDENSQDINLEEVADGTI